MTRILVSLVIGCIITLALFAFMSKLIENDAQPITDVEPAPVIDVINEPEETKVNTKNPPKPIQPVQAPPPSPVDQPEPLDDLGDPGPNFTPDVGTPDLDTGPDTTVLAPAEGDAQPIVRVEPKYPLVAQRDGIIGYVIMQFDIQPDGTTSNIEVLEAEPKRTFNREAIQALKKWKYRPKVVDGKSVPQTQQQVRLDFNMAD